MIINPVSIIPNVIDSSIAVKKKQRDNKHLPEKTPHQEEDNPSSEENPSSTESFPFSKSNGEEFEEDEEERTPRIDITV